MTETLANQEHLGVVLEGADALAQWLEIHPETVLDLEGASLDGIDLRDASLRDANLKGANLTGALLTRASVAGADLQEAALTS